MGDPILQSGEKPDPTGNVLQLVDAANRRQDDLREAESRRVNEQMALRAEYDEKLRDAEAKRIDAIRAVDVNAVGVASERAAQQATVLANQVAASAETLRALVATTASANAQQLAQITTQFTDRLALLEKAQYEGTGKQSVADPQMAGLLLEIKALRESGFQASGMKVMVGWLVAGVFLIIAVAGFGLALFKTG